MQIKYTLSASSTTGLATTMAAGVGPFVPGVTSGFTTGTVPNAARTITLVTSGNNTGVTFTIIGTSENCNYQTETVVGTTAGTQTTTKYFKTIDSITVSQTTVGTLSVGYTNVIRSPLTSLIGGKPAVVTAIKGGTVTFTVSYSNAADAVSNPASFVGTVSGLAAQTANITGIALPSGALAVRVDIASHTSGVLEVNVTQ